MNKRLFLIGMVLLFTACKEDPIPKPRAYLRLDYPAPDYISENPALPFLFGRNKLVDSLSPVKQSRDGSSLGIDLVYNSMKATLYLTYKEIKPGDLKKFLIDAQKVTQTHTIKADEIVEQPYSDQENRVFGMFYEVGGDAASQSQFYVTDSLNHFVTGSLYFYAKPNYDSILPAAYYLRNDMKHIMETIRWKDK